MNNILLALSLYLGLIFLFLTSSLSLLNGVSAFTALSRGITALLMFASLGFIASVVVRSTAVKMREEQAKVDILPPDPPSDVATVPAVPAVAEK